jgi:hypothetical protein
MKKIFAILVIVFALTTVIGSDRYHLHRPGFCLRAG